MAIQTIHLFKESDTIQFTLMKREKDSTICLPRSRWTSKKQLYPGADDPDSIFSRFIITSNVHSLLHRENLELQKSAKESISCGDDSLPFILTAQEMLQVNTYTNL